MISGVLLVILGEAMVSQSRPHLEWALLFFLINAVYIPLLEEPPLRERFGDAYQQYCRHVPRLVPRLRPWRMSPRPSRGHSPAHGAFAPVRVTAAEAHLTARP
jgi:hypothetical protein